MELVVTSIPGVFTNTPAGVNQYFKSRCSTNAQYLRLI